jgi:hypothetical protein
MAEKVIPYEQIKSLILLDPAKVDAALAQYESAAKPREGWAHE